ncbi:MAG: fumarate hydratase [Synergistaceae bacterium]|nr:fumarate hydratase [Synergistaceae bacterium]
MREIPSELIAQTVERLFWEANYILPPDMISLLRKGEKEETSPEARAVLESILENAALAAEGEYPLCQDCGMAAVFVDLGQEILITGDSLEAAATEGVRRAYDKGYLRKSIVGEPLFERKNTGDNTPALLRVRIVPGDKIKITAAPKGAGSENMSALTMLSPAAGAGGVEEFVVDTVRKAGPNPCPPIVVGVGVGSNFEGVADLAKRALLRPEGEINPHPQYSALEDRLLHRINGLGIGAAGYGGTVTALGVKVEWAPTHIASLPVAVSICCHANRHSAAVI